MKPRCLLLDLDGTLIDTAPDLGHALNLLLAEQDAPQQPPEAIRPQCSFGARGLIGLGFNLEPSDREYEPLRLRFLELYRDNLARESQPFIGFDQVLEAVAAEGGGRSWGIVTNKPAWLTEPLVAEMTFPSSPACVVSGDSAAHAKPHPAPLQLACEQTGYAAAECLYVGDSARDIQAAHAAGMPALAAAWGYIDHPDEAENWGADGVAQQPPDILDWFNRS